MPKGVYDRGTKGRWAKAVETPTIQPINENPGDTRLESVGIQTAIVDQQPELQKANASVSPSLQTHGDDEISTSQRLFGDTPEEEPEAVQDPLRQPEPVAQKTEEPKPISEPEAEPEPKAPTPEAPGDDFIDWEKLSGKKVRLKVDGKEVIVTGEDLKKYSDKAQIDRHLADAGDKLGEERRRLAEERKQLVELRQQRQNQYEAPIQNGQPQGGTYQQQSQADYSNPVFQRIQQLESQNQQIMAQNQQMMAQIAPVIYQSNRTALDISLKSRGFNDFNDYWPRVAANVTPQLIQAMNENEMMASEFVYFQLKAQDMATAPKAAPVVPRRTIEPTQPIPATQIDSGSSIAPTVNDDGGHQLRQAFKRAMYLGDDREAWNEVLKQKGVIPDA